MSNEKNETTHESYGLLSIGNRTSSEVNLFGSSIRHDRTIVIEVHRAAHERKLSNDYYYPGETVIEVEMSRAQFAEAITTPDRGTGVPCTIRRVNDTTFENPPRENKGDVFAEEFERHIRSIVDGSTYLMPEAMDILKNKTSISKSDREIILGSIKKVQQEIEKNMPFIFEQFREHMEKVVVAAKTEVDGFIQTAINRRLNETGLGGGFSESNRLTGMIGDELTKENTSERSGTANESGRRYSEISDHRSETEPIVVDGSIEENEENEEK